MEGPAVMPSPFSLPMPEFDQALFPSFDASVPKLPPLPPLSNEDDARAALTDTSRFYFLDGGGLAAATQAPGNTAIGDLKLPRNQFDIGSVRRDFPRLISLIEHGKLDVGNMVTKTMHLHEVNDAITAMQNGEVIRSVLIND